MPKTKRDLLKRQVAHAHVNITLAITHILNIEQAFHNVHPNKAEAAQVCVVGLTEVLKVLEHFWTACWGPLPSDWEAWRNENDSTRIERAQTP